MRGDTANYDPYIFDISDTPGLIKNPWDIVKRFKIKKVSIRDLNSNLPYTNRPLSKLKDIEELELIIE